MLNKNAGVLLGKTLIGIGMLFALLIGLNIAQQLTPKDLHLNDFTTPISLGLTACFMYLLFERKKGFAAVWIDRQAARKTFTGIIMAAIMMGITMTIMLVTGDIMLAENSWQWDVIALQVLMFLFVAIGEEWLFRGYFFSIYNTVSGVSSAIILNSILFTFIHLVNPDAFARPIEHIVIEMANIFMLSVLMSFARAISGSLWMPIGIHFAVNMLQSLVFGFVNGGKEVDSLFHITYGNKTVWNGAGYGLESSLMFTPILLMTVLIIIYAKSKESKKRKKSQNHTTGPVKF